MLHCKKFRTVKAKKPHSCAVFCAFCLLLGGSTIVRHHLAKYKIQLVFLAVSQRVGLYILLPLYLFRHAGAAYGRSLLFFCALLQQNRPLHFTEKSYRASRPFCFFSALLQPNRPLYFTENSYRASRPFCFFRALLQQNRPLHFIKKSYRASRPFCFFSVRCCSQTGRYTLQRILTGRAAAVYSVFLRLKIPAL